MIAQVSPQPFGIARIEQIDSLSKHGIFNTFVMRKGPGHGLSYRKRVCFLRNPRKSWQPTDPATLALAG